MQPGTVMGRLRFAAPQCVTALRIVLAVIAMAFLVRQQFGLAMGILIYGLATDAVDGYLARRLGVTSQFGELFDYFSDYLYYIAIPTLTTILVVEPEGFGTILLLSTPCVFAGMRYARKTGVNETEYPGLPGSPGLPTLAIFFYVVALTELWETGAISRPAAGLAFVAGCPVLGGLQFASLRFPKLSACSWLLNSALAGLMVMPFAFTAPLAIATLVLVVAYVVTGPLMVRQKRGDAEWTVLHSQQGRP
jgi:phosphatidylserine synthase